MRSTKRFLEKRVSQAVGITNVIVSYLEPSQWRVTVFSQVAVRTTIVRQKVCATEDAVKGT